MKRMKPPTDPEHSDKVATAKFNQHFWGHLKRFYIPLVIMAMVAMWVILTNVGRYLGL